MSFLDLILNFRKISVEIASSLYVDGHANNTERTRQIGL